MSKISKKTFENIKKESIKPTPGWVYGLKEDAIWAVVFVSLIIMIVSFSIIVGIFYETDWQFINYANISLYQYFLTIVPSIWLILFLISSFLFYEGLRHTKNGYKTENKFLFISSSFLILIMAVVLELPGYNLMLEQIGSRHLPFENDFEDTLMTEINHPENGVVVGRVTKVMSNSFNIVDLTGKTWLVSISNQELPSFVDNCHLVMVYGKTENDSIVSENLKPLYKNKYLIEYNPGCR